MRSFIVDPTGAILAEATKDQPVASAELDLDRVIQQPWLGDMKTRTWKERRPDLPIE
jgi:predicted amidohydrolase